MHDGETFSLQTDDFSREMADLAKEIIDLYEENPFLIETTEGIARLIGRNVKDIEPVIHQLCSQSKLKLHSEDGSITYLSGQTRDTDPWGETQFDLSNLDTEMLTTREHEVMVLLLEGLTYTEIADKLSISTHTVKNHVNAVYHKLEVSRRAELFSKIMGTLS